MRCESADQVLVAGAAPLTCGEAERVPDYLHLLAARGMQSADRRTLIGWVGRTYKADPNETRAWLDGLSQEGRRLELLTGIDGAETRSKAVYAAAQGEGLIREAHGKAYELQTSLLSVWASDPQTGLALTESDIEGWIRYASLCRQVQGAGVVALSVADRVQVYRMLQERFQDGDRAVQVALTAMGPYWSQIHGSWEAASYERQQAWIREAPLPPPMTATSLGYIEALIQGDLSAHARVLHERLGPFTMVKGRRAFPD